LKVINMPFVEKFDVKADELMNYETILNAVDIGVCLFDQQGFVTFVNDAYCDLFRTTRDKSLGLSLYKGFKDELSLRSLKFQRRFEGKINYHIGNDLLFARSYPVFKERIHLGVLTTYEREPISDDLKSPEYPLSKNPFEPMIMGQHPSLLKELLIAQKAARSNTTIMVRGESGTGKELVARAIHNTSKRAQYPFITVNCGAIPANLLESELFGYVQGAFTGAAKDKAGKFELANRGTIFLDEIGDLPLEMQAKLLRVLQEREVERIGSNKSIPVDVRVITATHKPLEKMIDEGLFRDDLFYRLNVIPIFLPPLRTRHSDIETLIKHFIEQYMTENCIETLSLSEEALKCLSQYNWPGNIRELKNTIERLVVLSENQQINLQDIPSHISEIYRLSRENRSIVETNGAELYTFEEYEREIIRLALKQYKSFNLAGKALGITHKTVAAKARKYNLIDS